MNYRCLVCETKDKWVNVDEYRIKPSGMCMCGSCGFITYPKRLSESDETLKEFYRNDYRKPPTVNNLFTGERKLQYHRAFLTPLYKKWKGLKLEDPKIVEIGSAFGMFLNDVRNVFPKAQLHGTELTKSFRANAWEEYGINLTEEIDYSKKYDLIASYKVAEHIPNIDRDLRKYTEALTEDGVVYISVPVWFEGMTNFGVGGFDIEYYFHPNHVNVWNKQHFEYLLKKAGLEIVGDNHCYYDSTYMCKRNDKLMKEPMPKWDTDKTVSDLGDYQKAAKLVEKKKYKEAIETVGCFPLAWSAQYESNRAEFHKLGYDKIREDFIKPAMGTCPNSSDVCLMAIDITMRYSKWDDAFALIDHGNKMSPNNVGVLTAMSHCFRQLALSHEKSGDYKKASESILQARDTCRHVMKISAQQRDQMLSWSYNDNARYWEFKQKAGLWDGQTLESTKEM